MQTEKNVYSYVRFSPKKRDLLVSISKEPSRHSGADIKKFKPSTESNSLRVTDFTKTKKVGILTRNHDLGRTKISTIINEI